MIWIITGADRTTGLDRSLRIDSPTRAEAEARANLNGLLVASAEPEATGQAFAQEKHTGRTILITIVVLLVAGVALLILKSVMDRQESEAAMEAGRHMRELRSRQSE